jgi:hypothetical protein
MQFTTFHKVKRATMPFSSGLFLKKQSAGGRARLAALLLLLGSSRKAVRKWGLQAA